MPRRNQETTQTAQAVDFVYLLARHLAETPSPDTCVPLQYGESVATLEYWRLVPTESGPYLLEGLVAGHGITAVAIAIYARAIARTAERWVILGRPLDGHLPEFDESDVIRRAAHWIVAMDAREEAEHAEWKPVPE